MASDHKKSAIREIRIRYSADWNVKIIPVGVELCRAVSPELMQHVCFNFVRDDLLGLRVQPGLGVTFSAVNAARDAISPRHQHTVDVITGFTFLNNLINSELRQNGGWLFEADTPLQPAIINFFNFVDETIQQVGYFESLKTINDYILAVETNRWIFLGVMPTYLYALLAIGDVAKAKQLAAEHRASLIKICSDRGFILRESDTQAYDDILSISG